MAYVRVDVSNKPTPRGTFVSGLAELVAYRSVVVIRRGQVVPGVAHPPVGRNIKCRTRNGLNDRYSGIEGSPDRIGLGPSSQCFGRTATKGACSESQPVARIGSMTDECSRRPSVS